jgi:hypothetical protein
MVKEINVTRKALGQPLLGKTTVITADGFPEDMKLENPPPPPPVGDVIDFMGSGAYEGFKTLTTDQFKTDILKQHPEFAQPENEARLDALAERAFEAYLKLAKNGKSSASDVKAMLDRVVENGKPGSVLTAEDAVPVDVVNKDAVRKQVALRYREFLTQAAREAMSRNEPLPAEPALTQSQYKGKVDAIVNRIVAEYGLKMQNDRAYIDTRWEEQIKRDGFVVAEGVPETFLRDQVEDFIVEDARRTGSPFAKLVDAFRNEGTQKIEVKEYERRMELFREIVKH